MAWAAGQRVNQGKYKILKVLGSGGFGITYKAEFDLAGAKCQVAIKTPNATLQAASPAEYAQFVRLFRKEARTMAGLRQLSQQLSMAQVTDFFEETQGRQQDPLPCLVMDFIAGTSLWERVKQRGPLAEGEALAYIGEVGKALAALHGQGMVHRDAHPMNIMIRESRAILIDFGLACSIVPMGSAYVNAGFPHFAAPEQWRGNREPTVDIYTLAGSLYFALTGRVPDLRTPPKTHNPELSQGVNDAIVQALSLYPDQRPATMEQWLQALGQAHRAAPPPLPPPPSPPLPPSPSPSSTKPSPPLVQPVTAKTVVAVPPPIVPPSPVAGLRTETVTVEVLTGVDAAGNGGRRQAVPVQRWLEDLGGGVTLALVRMPAGSFVMGSPEKEQKRYSDEGPQHRVNFPRDGWLGQFAVTQAQYQAVMGRNPATRYDSKFIDPQKPVVGVSWDEAVEFCDRLSHNTGRAYRLPTEAEWEYACRAGTTTPFSFGETLTPDLANYNGNSTYGQGPKGIYRQKTTTVGSFLANPWGLYDMHGNVWEWCLDPWSDNYSWKTEDHPALKDGTIILPYSNTSRVLRGGSWYNYPRYCRSAYRGRITRDGFDFNGGFRLVLASRTP